MNSSGRMLRVADRQGDHGQVDQQVDACPPDHLAELRLRDEGAFGGRHSAADVQQHSLEILEEGWDAEELQDRPDDGDRPRERRSRRRGPR